MIISEHERRWIEICFYQFCIGMYSIRQKSIDMIDMADAICLLADIDNNKIRMLINQMMHDTYYTPTKREIILIAHLKGYSSSEINQMLEKKITRQGINKFIKENLKSFVPIPRCEVEDDRLLYKFIMTFNKVKNIGI